MAGGERATALPKLCYGGRRYDGAFPLISVTASEEGKKRDTEEEKNRRQQQGACDDYSQHLKNPSVQLSLPPTPLPPRCCERGGKDDR